MKSLFASISCGITTIIPRLGAQLASLADSLLANSCLLCQGATDSQETPKGDLIPLTIDPYIPVSHLLCTRCTPKFESRVGLDLLQTQRRYSPQGIRQLKSVWKMETEVEAILKALKYRSITPLAGILAQALAAYLTEQLDSHITPEKGFASATWDYIIPVPSSPKDERQRRFSHTALLASELSKRIAVPCKLTELRSEKTVPRQALTTLEDRAENVANKFHTRSRMFVEKTILLLDDTTTTGETLAACAAVLSHAGASTIDALTIARSPRFYSNAEKIRSFTYQLEQKRKLQHTECNNNIVRQPTRKCTRYN